MSLTCASKQIIIAKGNIAKEYFCKVHFGKGGRRACLQDGHGNLQSLKKDGTQAALSSALCLAADVLLLRFWYRFVYEGEDQIALGMGEVLYHAQQKAIRTFLDHGFEDLIIDYMTEQNMKGNLPHYYDVIRNYRVENSQIGRSIELDGLAESIDDERKSLLVIEDKYCSRSFGLQDFSHLEESVSVFTGYRQIDYYLFSRGGFTEELISSVPANVHLFGAEDVFH